MLVKPMNTPDLVRQLEALLISHEDKKQRSQTVPVPQKASSARRSVAEPGLV